MKGGVGTLYSGSCGKSRTIGMWLHLGINVLSTLLLSGSNYTQQCLAAPTRREIDAAHARRRWMDIGVPSVRNLFRIKPERRMLWFAIGFTSIPLHLLYNSAVYTSLAANDFVVTVVSNNHFEPGAYSNMTETLVFGGEQFNSTLRAVGKTTGRYETNSEDIQLFGRVLEGYNTGSERYDDLTASNCTKIYNTEFMSNNRNLILITKLSSNDTHKNTLLDMVNINSTVTSPSDWMCAYNLSGNSRNNRRNKFICDPREKVEISGCKSERTDEKCKVQFSLGIMTVVICCNLIKACSMVMTVVRSREPTLVTLGDAVDSFLRIPDPTTKGMCFADRGFVDRKWRRGWRAVQTQHWKRTGVQRWWTSISKTRWITCNFFCSIIIIITGMLLGVGRARDGRCWETDIDSMWTRGFGKVNSISLVNLYFGNITEPILLANLPQTILSFLYLTYNSLFTCMLSGHEWSLFSHHHRTLRVTSPRPGQRSTYWLQVPYTYAIPLMTLSGLLHWLTSQSIFLARVEISGPLGGETSSTINTVGYSCIAIIFVLTLGTLALVTAVGMGYRPFAAEITTVGSCSAAISAACHAQGEDPEVIIGRKVRWGDVGIDPNLGICSE
ncbi:hypothetical protein C7212DRAFT_359553 [Tuber magnatum]|uniref:DUF6536 domain-containing protein n=1 Tax=Tuber magnatum TaxID=42249 RepID=A0A317SH05_9PEZI|nr:hypothetical protein C7212DRAFT_359553 [Tuber magnatum]